MFRLYKSDILPFIYGLSLVYYRGVLGPIKPMDIVAMIIIVFNVKNKFKRQLVLLALLPLTGFIQTMTSTLSGSNLGVSSVVRVLFGVIFVLAAYLLYSRGKVKRLISGFVYGVTITGLLSILQKFGIISGDNMLYRNSVATNIQGYFSDPNRFAFAIFLSAFLIRLFPEYFKKSNYVLLALALISLFVGSRTLVLLLPFILLVGISYRQLIVIVGMASMVILKFYERIISSLYIISKFTEGGVDYRNDPRYLIIIKALESIKRNPLGSGIDEFAVTYQLTSHNTYLELILISGIFGVFSVVSLGIHSLRYVRRVSVQGTVMFFALSTYLATINILFMGFAITILTVIYLNATRVVTD